MKINEIEEGSSVSLLVTKADTSVELPSEIVKVLDGCVLANLFKHGDSTISFDSPGLNFEMMVVKPGEVPYNFKNVKISLVTYEGGTYHCLQSGTTGVRLNRRNAFRVFIGEDGNVLDAKSGRNAQVTVKDISSTGVGFLVEGANASKTFEVGSRIRVNFKDPENGTTIDAEAKIVRIMDMEEGRTLYGCMFTKHYPAIEHYTATKQLKNRNMKGALRK